MRPLVVTHLGVCGSGSLNQVLATLPDAAGLPVFDATPGNPIERATLDALAQTLAEGCEGAVCLGGGSSIDLGQSVVLLAVSGEPHPAGDHRRPRLRRLNPRRLTGSHQGCSWPSGGPGMGARLGSIRQRGAVGGRSAVDIVREQVLIDPLCLPGMFDLVAPAKGLVVFVHGSGSDPLSRRNLVGDNYLADVLHQTRLSTLMFNLLTPAEATDRHKGFDIELLASRVGQAIKWAGLQPAVGRSCLGLFGVSTGAAAALCAAAARPNQVMAVVSRGSRPDLVTADLQAVQAPTLRVVGTHDPQVLQLHRHAMRLLRCQKRLEVVPGATHLFEQPGALDTVADLAGAWFANHFSTAWRS